MEASLSQILSQLLDIIKNWSPETVMVSVSALLCLLISTMKNSFIRGLVWDRLPEWAKMLSAPLISLVAFSLTVTPFNLKAVLAALITGAGAVLLANLLKSIRDIPGIGPVWVKVVDIIGSFLGKPEEKLLKNR